MWIDDISPPQAIHFDIDADYAARYYDDVAKLWRKGGKNKVLGLQLRIVPCFSSPVSVAISDEHRTNIILMASKQQYYYFSGTYALYQN